MMGWLLAGLLASLFATGARAQELLVAPEFGEVGEAVTVTLLSSDGVPESDVLVEALAPGDAVVRLGRTDAKGSVQITPEVPGEWEFHARLHNDQLLLITPYHVEPARWRWLWAGLFVPLGAGLLALNLRRLRRPPED